MAGGARGLWGGAGALRRCSGGAPGARGGGAVAQPLAEGPAVFAEGRGAVSAWARAQRAAIARAPAARRGDLEREFEWLLEDAAARGAGGAGPGPGSGRGGGGLRLRRPLAALRGLWDARMEDRVPYQYLAGACHWYDMVLAVGPGVLIPRPETEELLDLAKAHMRGARGGGGVEVWADLGTGSGALAIGLARALPLPRLPVAGPAVWAVDASPVARLYAAANAERLGVSGAVRVVGGSWFEPLKGLEGRLDGIVSNPPYIPSEDLPGLQAEVGRHEPALALDGGPGDGLGSLVPVAEGSARFLREGGFFGVETNGHGQAQLLAARMACMAAAAPGGATAGAAFRDVRVVPDLSGVERFVTAVKA